MIEDTHGVERVPLAIAKHAFSTNGLNCPARLTYPRCGVTRPACLKPQAAFAKENNDVGTQWGRQ